MTVMPTIYGFNVTRFAPWDREILFCTAQQTIEVIPGRCVRAGSQEWQEWENEVKARDAKTEGNKELLDALKLAASRLESGNEVDQACARHCRTAIAKAEQRT